MSTLLLWGCQKEGQHHPKGSGSPPAATTIDQTPDTKESTAAPNATLTTSLAQPSQQQGQTPKIQENPQELILRAHQLAKRHPNVPSNLPESMNLLQLACDQESGEGCALLGIIYADGFSRLNGHLKPDLKKAKQLLERSCELGWMKGCTHLGRIEAFFPLQETSANYTHALSLANKACDAGEPTGCLFLARLYADDALGASKDIEKSREISQKLCTETDAIGCYFFASLQTDPDEALSLFESACNDPTLQAEPKRLINGTNTATDNCIAAARLYFDASYQDFFDHKGLNVLRPLCSEGITDACHILSRELEDFHAYEEAVSVLETACSFEDDTGCHNAAMHYSHGLGPLNEPPVVAIDLTKSAALFERACNLNSSISCNFLAEMHQKGQIGAPNPTKAKALYRKACEQDSTACGSLIDVLKESPSDQTELLTLLKFLCHQQEIAYHCTALADVYLSGPAQSRDPTQAYALFAKACDGGSPSGCMKQANMLQEGIGVSADTAQAFNILYHTCAAQFDESTCIEAFRLAQVSSVEVQPERKKYLENFLMAAVKQFNSQGILQRHLLGMAKLAQGSDFLRLTSQDIKEVERSQSACAKSHPLECIHAAVMVYMGDADKIQQAIDLSTQACQNKIGLGCSVKARLECVVLGSENEDGCVKKLKKTCEDDQPEDCLAIANILLRLEDESKQSEARALNKKLCEQKFSGACASWGSDRISRGNTKEAEDAFNILKNSCYEDADISSCDQLVFLLDNNLAPRSAPALKSDEVDAQRCKIKYQGACPP